MPLRTVRILAFLFYLQTKILVRTGEVAQLLNSLSHEHEDLNLERT